MDSNVTYNSIVFAKSYDDATGSVRQSTARAINTPDVLTIKHMEFTDSSTKAAMTRHTIRLDSLQIDSESVIFKNDAYLVIDICSKATTVQVNALIATIRAAIANTTAGSDILAAVLNNER